MRRIVKGPAPDVIASVRRTPEIGWDGRGLAQRGQLRASLRAEQRGLCAYCNRRLPPMTPETAVDAYDPAVRIELWRPRSASGTDPFAWEDLLACCSGGGAAARLVDRTCDRRKEDQALTVHPARPVPDPEQAVRLNAGGRATAKSAALQGEVDDVLGLNAPLLCSARRRAAVAVLQFIEGAMRRPRPVAAVRHALDRYEAAEGDLPPFPTLGRFLLAQALARAEGIRDQRN